jgi:dipeptidyl aminopeptidase/acylaminoacyl peptidase
VGAKYGPLASLQAVSDGRISVEMIARSRVVAEPGWSPDGSRLAWLEAFGGRVDVVVAPIPGAVGPASGPPQVMTADAPVTSVSAYGGGGWCWAGPDHLVVASADGRLLLVPAAGGAPQVLSTEGQASAPAATPDGSRIAFVLEGPDRCDIAVVPADGSQLPVRISDADYAWDATWSPDGSRVAWHEWDLSGMSWDASRIALGRPDGTDAVVVAGGDEIAVGQPRFAPDGHALAYVSDESGWSNVWVAAPDGTSPRPLLAEEREHAEPAWGPGQRSFAWAPDASALAINRNEDGFGRLVVVPREGGTVVAVSRGWHFGLDWGPEGIACIRSGARTPNSVTVLRPDAGTQGLRRWVPEETEPAESTRDAGERQVVARGPVGRFEVAGLVEPEAVTWPGEDGAMVHGLLYRPPEADGAPPPLLVDVHGGPTGQATVAWTPRHQFFVARGWAVLAPDYRGSTGHGRAYAQALAGRWGELDVADTAAGIRAAGDRGWSDPARVAAMGASAGGLTVLLLCARHGDLVRAGVSLYGVTDLLELARTTHRFESRYLERVVGTLPRDEALYRERSPLTHASSIRIPMLVLQGDADRVVPPEQARAVVDAMQRAGGIVEHHVYEGEGHGWARPETVADSLTRIEAFLDRYVKRHERRST